MATRDTLQPLADGLWSVETLLPFPGGVRLPAHMTVVRLGTGELLLHSPVPLAPEVVAALRALGHVAHVFAPNKFHHRYAAAALKHFPDAYLWGAPGLPEKRPDLTFAGVLTDQPPPSWRGGVELVLVQGAPILNEVVLFHPASATVIATDLLFNVTHPATFATHAALWTMGTRGRFAQSRWWRFYTRQRQEAARSAERILRWDFQRVLMSHGDPVVEAARERTQEALEWMVRPSAARKAA